MIGNGPSQATNGLILHYDLGNRKSFAGMPAVNLVTGGNVNGYPSSGNGWGTYNTNQYGSGTYRSIGTVASVTNNIVTWTAPHGLRTYDVMRAQTSGGGVTLVTDYYIQAWSTTSFSLHAYNGSQDGTTPMATIIAPVVNDVRLSINATGFPTMWYGAPHLANSGLIKTIIPNGFTRNGVTHDCMRMNYFRTDLVQDGMAYGLSPTLVEGKAYTIQFYYRTLHQPSIAAAASITGFQIYLYGNGQSFSKGTNAMTADWQLFSFQVTATAGQGTNGISLYWLGPNFPAQSHWDLAEIMVYEGTAPTPYTPSTAPVTVTSSMKDLTGTTQFNVTNLSYDAGGKPYFAGGGTNKITYAESRSISNATARSWEVVCKPTATQGDPTGIFGHVVANGCSYFCDGGIMIYSGQYIFGWFDNTSYQWLLSGVNYVSGQYAHVICTWDPSDLKARIYVNGELKATSAVTNLNYGGAYNEVQVGYGSASAAIFVGYVDIIKHYFNECLTADEVTQNFAAIRGRFGL